MWLPRGNILGEVGLPPRTGIKLAAARAAAKKEECYHETYRPPKKQAEKAKRRLPRLVLIKTLTKDKIKRQKRDPEKEIHCVKKVPDPAMVEQHQRPTPKLSVAG